MARTASPGPRAKAAAAAAAPTSAIVTAWPRPGEPQRHKPSKDELLDYYRQMLRLPVVQRSQQATPNKYQLAAWQGLVSYALTFN